MAATPGRSDPPPASQLLEQRPITFLQRLSRFGNTGEFFALQAISYSRVKAAKFSTTPVAAFMIDRHRCGELFFPEYLTAE